MSGAPPPPRRQPPPGVGGGPGGGRRGGGRRGARGGAVGVGPRSRPAVGEVAGALGGAAGRVGPGGDSAPVRSSSSRPHSMYSVSAKIVWKSGGSALARGCVDGRCPAPATG